MDWRAWSTYVEGSDTYATMAAQERNQWDGDDWEKLAVSLNAIPNPQFRDLFVTTITQWKREEEKKSGKNLVEIEVVVVRVG